MSTTLAQAIADAARRHGTPGPLANPDLHKLVPQYISFLEREFLPSGSGFNNGTKVDLDACTESKLVFTTTFHHMNDGGYDGWTDHKVTAHATFSGHRVKVTGRNRNDIKDYIGDCFHHHLTSCEVPTFWHWATTTI